MKWKLPLNIVLCLFSLKNASSLACSDPCPNGKFAQQFGEKVKADWDATQDTPPSHRGVFSYFTDGQTTGQYMAFVADQDTLLVEEASCELEFKNSASLRWVEPSFEESETIKALERFYQSMEPVRMRKAVYHAHWSVYLLEIFVQGKTQHVFRVYRTAADGGLKPFGGAFAHPM